jgi:hypothetical protein
MVTLRLTKTGEKTIIAARKIVRALDHKLTKPIGGSEGARTAELIQTLRALIHHHDNMGEE